MLEQLQDYIAVIVSGLFASVCGALSYFLKVEEGHMFRITEFVVHVLISGASGLITYLLLQSLGMAPNFCAALSGIAGWMGTNAMKMLEILFIKRLGMKDDSNG